MTFRFWKPPQSKKKTEKLAFDGTPFVTKLDLAAEMLKWARSRGFRPTAVLFDAYYLAKPVLKVLKKAKWQWVSRLKSNRNLEIDGTILQLGRWEHLFAKGWASKPRISVRAGLSGWGEVRVIALKAAHQAGPRYLIGSNPEWGKGTIERLYSYRWDIEVSFRDTRQLAGLNDCQCRSFRAQENHVALVFLSYLFVVAQSKPADSAGKTLTRLNAQSVAIAGDVTVPGVRPIKRERRNRLPHPLCVTPSAQAA